MRRAVYAGSFDPPTNGHMWMIREGARLFDELIVAVGVNPDKKYTFSTAERLQMLREAVEGLEGVSVDSFESQFLVHYANSVGAGHLLRGIRDVAGFEFERGMRHINHDLQPEVTTVFLMPPRDIAEVSSSLVKGLVGPDGWPDVAKKYVPPAVHKALVEKFTDA